MTRFIDVDCLGRIEGDIQQLQAEHQVTEFWEVLNGTKPGKASDEKLQSLIRSVLH